MTKSTQRKKQAASMTTKTAMKKATSPVVAGSERQGLNKAPAGLPKKGDVQSFSKILGDMTDPKVSATAADIYAKSKAGCYGLCQLNPTYFPADLDAHGNIAAGMEYLGDLLKKYGGDLPAALRAYNRGYDDGWRGYSNAVLANAAKWCEILDMEARG